MCPWADFCPHRAHALCLQRRSSAAPEAQDGGTAGACPVQASLTGQPPRRLQDPHSPGPQTVDLIPVFSSTGTRLMAPSMCWVNTSQSRSKRPKANLSDTWGGGQGTCPVTASHGSESQAGPGQPLD